MRTFICELYVNYMYEFIQSVGRRLGLGVPNFVKKFSAEFILFPNIDLILYKIFKVFSLVIQKLLLIKKCLNFDTKSLKTNY